MEKQLNYLLANLVVEYHKLQSYHWYIKGENFFTVHAKLEELYNYVNKAVDEIAEVMLMMNMKPSSNLKAFLENSSINEANSDNIMSKDIFKEILNDFTLLLEDIKNIKILADETENDFICTSMDNYIQHFTKSIWMIKQVLAD